MGNSKAVPVEMYDHILDARRAGMSISQICEKFDVSDTLVKYVWRDYRAAAVGDLAALERQGKHNQRIYRWALKFLPDAPQQDQQMSINDWTADPRVFPSPAPGLSAAKITETAMALLVKSIDEDGENADFLRGLLALYKQLTAPGSSM